ncbi:AI-2E family transporter [Lichenibacterium dinghuense]|uniref:AI-2E family transporter n=1 Tax=Lichenibacterium dinghuense TaxID=2895977 RepID=UPI001F3B871F|nr:AI-2E family transporter [Lichenibacterium sp. 6Y81]
MTGPEMSCDRRSGAEPPGWATAATITGVLAILYFLRYALMPILLVAALAFVLRPIVRFLQRRLRVPKLAGVLVVYVAVLAVAGLVAWYLVGEVGEKAVKGASDAPHLLTEEIRRLFGPQVHAFGRDVSAEDLSRRIVDGVENAVAKPELALLAGGAVVGAPAVSVLMLVVLFYFLNSGRQLVQGLLHLFPPRYRAHLTHLGTRVEPMLRHYVRGVLVVTIYTAAVSELVLGLVFHVSFAPLVSVAVGVLEIIPVVGPAASIALFAVAAVVDGHGLWTFASFMGLAIFLRVSTDNVVGPLVLGRAVTLHPVVIIIAFLIGASLFGIIGVFVAVPVAAAVKIVLAVWYGEDDGQGERASS